jgi:hypothetical protein
VDGKRRGAVGRLLDGLTGEGPDVYVVSNGDRRTLHRDLPHRTEWSGWDGRFWDPNWGHPDKDRTLGENVHFPGMFPWATRTNKKYNFYTRRYETPRRYVRNQLKGKLWTDAYWPDGAKRFDMNPLTVRVNPWQYGTRVPWTASFYPGGR